MLRKIIAAAVLLEGTNATRFRKSNDENEPDFIGLHYQGKGVPVVDVLMEVPIIGSVLHILLGATDIKSNDSSVQKLEKKRFAIFDKCLFLAFFSYIMGMLATQKLVHTVEESGVCGPPGGHIRKMLGNNEHARECFVTNLYEILVTCAKPFICRYMEGRSGISNLHIQGAEFGEHLACSFDYVVTVQFFLLTKEGFHAATSAIALAPIYLYDECSCTPSDGQSIPLELKQDAEDPGTCCD